MLSCTFHFPNAHYEYGEVKLTSCSVYVLFNHPGFTGFFRNFVSLLTGTMIRFVHRVNFISSFLACVAYYTELGKISTMGISMSGNPHEQGSAWAVSMGILLLLLILQESMLPVIIKHIIYIFLKCSLSGCEELPLFLICGENFVRSGFWNFLKLRWMNLLHPLMESYDWFSFDCLCGWLHWLMFLSTKPDLSFQTKTYVNRECLFTSRLPRSK